MEAKLTDNGRLQEKIAEMNSLAADLRYQDIRRSIALTREVDGLVDLQGTNDAEILKELARSLLNRGSFLTQVGEYAQAIDALKQALDIFLQAGSPQEAVLACAQIGVSYLHLSSYVNALEYTLKGFELAGASSDRELEAVLLLNLGAIYVQREDYGRAMPYLLKSLQLAQDVSSRHVQAGAQEKLCLVYTALNNPQAAQEAGQASLEVYRQDGNRQGEAEALNSLGRAHQLLRDFASAKHCYTQAKQTAAAIGLRYELIRAQIFRASLHSQQDEHRKAVETLDQALVIAEEIGTVGKIVEIQLGLSTAYQRMQNYQKALFHYERFHEIKEQVFTTEGEAALQNLEVIYQVETVRREAEQEQQKNAVLQQEIAVRSQAERALKTANQQLQVEILEREQLIGDLDAFARMVAHDLKTPLQNLSLLSYLLERELITYPNAENSLSLVKQIQQTGMKTGSIINELLTMASLRTTDIELVELDMNLVIVEVLRRLRLMIEENGAEIVLATEFPLTRGYSPWLEEVLANFISNAIRYGGKPPRVELGADKAMNGSVRFWVRDNGNGINPLEQVKLFHDFTRLGSKSGGHGLGLSITRRIITKLGGQVGVESTGRQGEGSLFWFTLPEAIEKPPA